MPIYEYLCMKCKKDFEFLTLGKGDSVLCPECKSSNVKRQISACSYKSNGQYSAPSGGSSGCAGCSSGSCATCH